MIAVYQSLWNARHEARSKYREDLEQEIACCPKKELLIIRGDHNAHDPKPVGMQMKIRLEKWGQKRGLNYPPIRHKKLND